MDISLEDFYTFSKIELHLFSFEINEYKIQDISYLTHPKLMLMTAVQMTCAIPILITPVCFDDKCYIDGGMACNYPLNHCIESGKLPDEILAFKNKYKDEKAKVHFDSTMIDFLLNFIFKAVFSINRDQFQTKIKNEVICDATYLNIEILKNALSNVDVRKNLFNQGTDIANRFLSSLSDSNADLTGDLKNGV
jgi:predicted acylesterase/phospholipase RssA